MRTGPVLLCLLLLGGCAKHKYDAEWQVVIENCVNTGFSYFSAREDFDPESDIAFIEDTCSAAINKVASEYPDTHPDDLPSSVKDAAFDEAFEDCSGKGFLEGEAC